jgi:tRNA U34 5-carboxymethylaminomethyl modifying GTPase MnmE/TrmE
VNHRAKPEAQPDLVDSIVKGDLVVADVADAVDRGDVIFHLRQKLALENMRDRLLRAKRLMSDGHPEEMYVEEIREIVPALGRFLGEIRSEDVLADIFRRFCVGK